MSFKPAQRVKGLGAAVVFSASIAIIILVIIATSYKADNH